MQLKQEKPFFFFLSFFPILTSGWALSPLAQQVVVSLVISGPIFAFSCNFGYKVQAVFKLDAPIQFKAFPSSCFKVGLGEDGVDVDLLSQIPSASPSSQGSSGRGMQALVSRLSSLSLVGLLLLPR